MLDACCGQGDLLKYLKQKSNKVKLTGIDFHKNEPEEKLIFCVAIFLKQNLRKNLMWLLIWLQ